MDPARIAELLRPFLPQANDQRLTANDGLYQSISTYIDILLRWNARINLTAIRDPDEIVTRHFGESLFTARHLFPARPAVGTPSSAALVQSATGVKTPAINRPRLADVGSGAGFPGIPIKLWNPRIQLTLIEANHKKATFLREAARTLTLTDIDIFNGRAEDLAASQARFEVVTLRAVERFEDALRISAALVIPGGRLALLTGSSQQAAAARLLPSYRWGQPLPIPLSHSRTLMLGNSPEV